MKFTIVGSFGGAEEIYRSKPQLVHDVEAALHGLNIPLGYKTSASLPDDIQAAFQNQDLGWQRQVPSQLKLDTALGSRTSPKSVDLRHAKLRVDIEIERGNVGSFYRDIFKFNIHHNRDIIDLGIIIMPNRKLSLALGENIAWTGRFADELRISWACEANNDCPILLIELVPEHYPEGHSLLDQKAMEALRELQESRKGERSRYPLSRS